MTEPRIYTEDQIKELAVSIPEKIHGGFKNWLGATKDRLTVEYYLGKISDKHSWAASCSCSSGFIIVSSTSLSNIKSCGCYTREQTSKANKGNKAGLLNIKTKQTIEKLKDIKPEYDILDVKDGKVMTKWDFFCQECAETFSARPDNILDRKSGGSQTPCNCCVRGGYSGYKTGSIYLLVIDEYCKFGISNDFDKRYKQLCKSYGDKLALEFILTSSDGKMIYEIEKALKNKFDYLVDVGNIDGKTEYRLLSDKDSIIQEIIRVWTKDFKEK